MKKPIFAVILILALATMACSFSIDLPRSADTGPTETMNVNEPLPISSTEPVEVYFGMGAGKLDLRPGASALVEGTIRYNVDEWKPTITRSDTRLQIEQDTMENLAFKNDLVNEWELSLNNETPINLEIKAGAYEGEMDLSGLHLRNLDIEDGASKNEVTFNIPNPEVMDEFRYTTGASQVRLGGLANANFERMTFESGAGDYTLDFSGSLRADADVRVRSGVSQVTIIIPDGMRAVVEVDGGLNNVDVDGDWDKNGETYQTSGDGPLLTIEVDMGIGNLRLVQD